MTPLATTFAPKAQLLHHRRVQRYATDLFSFVEIALDIDVENEPRTIRLASLLAFEQGRPTGHLVYSVDVET